MFSYYGSKAKIVKHYPKPKYNLIIEPFAGAAWYSLYHNCVAILNEKNKIVFDIWNWLINQASGAEIEEYLDFYKGDDISQLDIRDEHKNLIGFNINRGTVHPSNIVQKWSCQSKKDKTWASTTHFALTRCVELLPKVKEWKVMFGDYKTIPNIEATYFIDPPYQYGGEHYPINDIDYTELKLWIETRKGQVIVCENDRADWMDFKPLTICNGQRKKSVECIFTVNQIV